MYGVRIMGYNGMHEFFTSSEETLVSLYNWLKLYCTLYHITNDYIIKAQIGNGHYSKVHLAGKLGTSENYAVKSIPKKYIIESVSTAVYVLPAFAFE